MAEQRMPTINQVAISGEVIYLRFRFSADGIPNLSLHVQATRSYRDREDKWQTEAVIIQAILSGKPAQQFVERLEEGSRVFLTGRLEGIGDENNPTALRLNVRNLQILEPDKEDAKKEEEEGYVLIPENQT